MINGRGKRDEAIQWLDYHYTHAYYLCCSSIYAASFAFTGVDLLMLRADLIPTAATTTAAFSITTILLLLHWVMQILLLLMLSTNLQLPNRGQWSIRSNRRITNWWKGKTYTHITLTGKQITIRTRIPGLALLMSSNHLLRALCS